MSSGRPVRFCGACGVRVKSTSETMEWKIAYCETHRPLVVAADTPPPDPLTTLPTLGAELRRESERPR